MRLTPACAMVVSASGAHIQEYWTPDLWSDLPYKRETDFVRHYRDLLFDTVRRTARSQAPLACEVSGGLNSSALFAVADDLLRHGRLTAPGLDGYTLAFDDESDANELAYARAMAKHVGRKAREVAPSRMSLDWYGEQARRYRDFPSFPNGVMGLAIREAARERGSRTLMTGVGGDQWLCGNPTYYADAVAARDIAAIVDYLKNDTRSVGPVTAGAWFIRFGVYPFLPNAFRRVLRSMLSIDRRENHEGIETFDLLVPALRAQLLGRIGVLKTAEPLERNGLASVGISSPSQTPTPYMRLSRRREWPRPLGWNLGGRSSVATSFNSAFQARRGSASEGQ